MLDADAAGRLNALLRTRKDRGALAWIVSDELRAAAAIEDWLCVHQRFSVRFVEPGDDVFDEPHRPADRRRLLTGWSFRPEARRRAELRTLNAARDRIEARGFQVVCQVWKEDLREATELAPDLYSWVQEVLPWKGPEQPPGPSVVLEPGRPYRLGKPGSTNLGPLLENPGVLTYVGESWRARDAASAVAHGEGGPVAVVDLSRWDGGRCGTWLSEFDGAVTKVLALYGVPPIDGPGWRDCAVVVAGVEPGDAARAGITRAVELTYDPGESSEDEERTSVADSSREPRGLQQLEPALRDRGLVWASRLAGGRPRAALAKALVALQSSRMRGDVETEIHALRLIALIHDDLGEPDAARQRLDSARALAEARRSPQLEALLAEGVPARAPAPGSD